MLRFSAALICAFQLLSPADAQDNPPGKSGFGDKPAKVVITNSLDKAMTVVWIDVEGMEKIPTDVQAGGTITLSTYNSHLWRFKVEGKVIGEYRVGDAAEQKYEVKPGQAAKPADAPAEDKPAEKKPTPSKFSPEEAKELVAFHNKARKDVGVEPVNWSPKLAEYAQAWADECARTGDVKHRPYEGEFAQKYGENLAFGYGADYGIMKGAEDWYAEIKFYKPGDPIPETPPKDSTGHYTQIVWRKTTEIGAGKAVVKTGKFKGWTVLICNYDPPGNRIGEVPY